MTVHWQTAGAATTAGFVVGAHVDDAAAVRLEVADNDSFTGSTLGPTGTPTSFELVKLASPPLAADTDWCYRIVLTADSSPVSWSGDVGRCRTAQTGPHSTRFWWSSCHSENSDPVVFDYLATQNYDFGANIGDVFYWDRGDKVEDFTAGVTELRDSYWGLQLSPTRKSGACYNTMSMAFVWDDHDFSSNDANKKAVGGPMARAAYKTGIPHYTLPDTGGLGIWQWFIRGRVLYLLLDSRSYRDRMPAVLEASWPSASMLGAEQKAWFKSRVDQLQNDTDLAMMVVLSPSSWSGHWHSVRDSWTSAMYERAELSNYIAQNCSKQIIWCCGDVHATLACDGRYGNDYSDGSTVGGWTPEQGIIHWRTGDAGRTQPTPDAAKITPPMHTYIAGSLRHSSVPNYGSIGYGTNESQWRSGPWTLDGTTFMSTMHKPWAGGDGGRAGDVEITDDGGDTLEVTVRGFQSLTGVTRTVLWEHSFTVDADGGGGSAPGGSFLRDVNGNTAVLRDANGDPLDLRPA